MDHTILLEVDVLLAAAVLAVVVFRRLNLPPILAYLLVGVVIGPHGSGWLDDPEDISFLAELGLVFLLFTIGLEFSLPQLISMKKEVLGIGGAQVLLTALLAGSVAWLSGLSIQASVIIGGVFAMSSTAVVIKQLREQLELHSRHGRTSVGILLFQDLAVIPFLILIPTFAGTADSVAIEMITALSKGAIVLVVMLAVGHWMLRPLFHGIVSFHSAELFTLTVLLFALTAAWVTQLFGLSLMLGAFLAGMMLGETAFRHQIEADIRPFRDVLMGLFFVTVGMLLDIEALPGIMHWVLLIAVSTMIIKLLLIMGLARLAGAEKGVALRTGVVLSQGGEFGFALIALALQQGDLLAPEVAQIVVAAIIISMVISPLMIRYNGLFAKYLFARSYGGGREAAARDLRAEASRFDQHVLICGFGRIGQNIARFVERAGFGYMALDLDPVRVQEANAAGQYVHYGDSTHLEMLEAAGLHRARVLVISFPDTAATLKILEQVRKVRPDIPILVRTTDDADLERLQQAGATEVVPETLEASLMLVSHLLYLLGIPVNRIVRQIQEVRSDRYRTLREFFHGQDVHDVEVPDSAREGLHTVTLEQGAFAVGRTIKELGLEEHDVTITAVRRDGARGLSPRPETLFQEGDVVVLYGTPEALEQAEAILLSG